jgi:hypothetical protein
MRKKVLAFTALPILALCSLRFASAFMLAQDVAAPHTGTWDILRRVVHPRYEVKVPHRGFFGQVRFRSCLKLTPAASVSTRAMEQFISKPAIQIAALVVAIAQIA